MLSFFSDSKAICGLKCSLEIECDGFMWNQDSKSCSLIQTTHSDATILPEKENNNLEAIYVPFGKAPQFMIDIPCTKNTCLHMFLSVLGNWGSWSVWKCTQRCGGGGGIERRIRHCNDPAPVPEIGCILSDKKTRGFNETEDGEPCNEHLCQGRIYDM